MADNKRMESAILDLLATQGLRKVELEWRVGQKRDGIFYPGVPRSRWDKMKAALDASPAFVKMASEYTEYLDFDEHKGKLVVQEGVEPHVMHKQKRAFADVDHGAMCIRESLAIESEDAYDRPPLPTRLRRHKKRWSYVYRNTFQVDLTLVTSNAPPYNDAEEEVAEVEVEICGRGQYVRQPLEYLRRFGESILMDMMAF